jgi:hypothetical protein
VARLAFTAGFLIAGRIKLLCCREGLTMIVIALEHGILEQITLKLLLHLNRRELKKLDRLLQLGR